MNLETLARTSSLLITTTDRCMVDIFHYLYFLLNLHLHLISVGLPYDFTINKHSTLYKLE